MSTSALSKISGDEVSYRIGSVIIWWSPPTSENPHEADQLVLALEKDATRAAGPARHLRYEVCPSGDRHGRSDNPACPQTLPKTTGGEMSMAAE
jgi:hypothetical protein